MKGKALKNKKGMDLINKVMNNYSWKGMALINNCKVLTLSTRLLWA
jgi:cephalosporin hydroxylase